MQKGCYNLNNRVFIFIKHPSLTWVKFIVLYKQLDKNHIYIHFNKQNLKCSIYHKHNHLANTNCSYIRTHTYTMKHTCTQDRLPSDHPLKCVLQLWISKILILCQKLSPFEFLSPSPTPCLFLPLPPPLQPPPHLTSQNLIPVHEECCSARKGDLFFLFGQPSWCCTGCRWVPSTGGDFQTEFNWAAPACIWVTAPGQAPVLRHSSCCQLRPSEFHLQPQREGCGEKICE